MPKTHPATLDEILTAQQHAQHAAETNQHLSSCPYRATNPDDEHGRFLQLTWARAYRETQALLRQDPSPTPSTLETGHAPSSPALPGDDTWTTPPC